MKLSSTWWLWIAFSLLVQPLSNTQLWTGLICARAWHVRLGQNALLSNTPMAVGAAKERVTRNWGSASCRWVGLGHVPTDTYPDAWCNFWCVQMRFAVHSPRRLWVRLDRLAGSANPLSVTTGRNFDFIAGRFWAKFIAIHLSASALAGQFWRWRRCCEHLACMRPSL